VAVLVLLEPGFWQQIVVEIGPAGYAEPYDPQSLLKMPANALVNLAYPVVGLYWLRRIGSVDGPPRERVMFGAFATGAILYGVVQALRIVTQFRAFAIADQWITLPFFAGVVVFNLRLATPRRDLRAPTVLIMTLSVASYVFVAGVDDGFERMLALHIAIAVVSCAHRLWRSSGRGGWAFCLALLSCSAFVGLKLADHQLAAVAPFSRLTGHFWSKIGDALQLHFILVFFAAQVDEWHGAKTPSARLPG